MNKVENSRSDVISPPLWCPRPGVLGIFAKEPQAGKVKTRLCPPLTFAEAAKVYHLSLRQTVAALAPWQPLIFYSGNVDYFRENFPGIDLIAQSTGDLGARMAQALQILHVRGNERALLIGSDAPDLPLSLITEALAALEHNEVVTIPARDGGYLLIAERGHHPALFQEIPWSSEAVLSCTRAICAAQKWSYSEIGAWEDVDNVADLLRLIKRAPTLEVCAYAAGILRNYGIKG